MSKEWDILHTSTMPVIALRGLTVFPNVLIHFEVSRVTSVRALEAAMTAGSPVFLVGQKDIAVEEPETDDLYQVGTISGIRQILRMPGDNVRGQLGGELGIVLKQIVGGPHQGLRPGISPGRGLRGRNLPYLRLQMGCRAEHLNQTATDRTSVV